MSNITPEVPTRPTKLPIPLRERGWFIVALLFCCFPVGLFLIWKHPRWTSSIKWTWTGVWAGLIILGALNSDKHDGAKTSTNSMVATEATPPTSRQGREEGKQSTTEPTRAHGPQVAVSEDGNEGRGLRRSDLVRTRVAGRKVDDATDAESIAKRPPNISAAVVDARNSDDFKRGYAAGAQMAEEWTTQLDRVGGDADAQLRISRTIDREVDRLENQWKELLRTQGGNHPAALQLQGKILGIKETLSKPRQAEHAEPARNVAKSADEDGAQRQEHAPLPAKNKKSGVTKTYKVKKGAFSSLTVELSPMVSEEVSLKDFSWEDTSLHFKLTWEQNRYGTSGKQPWKYVVYDKEGTKIDSNDVMIDANLRVGETVTAELWPLLDNKKKSAHRVFVHYKGE